MSGYLNEYEVHDCVRIFSDTGETPNLHTGSLVICALMEWADDNSDGWTYWRKPRQAAARLIDVLDDRRREHLRGHRILDLGDDGLKNLLVPIKSFLTKQDVSWGDDLPWAVIMPLYPTAVALD